MSFPGAALPPGFCAGWLFKAPQIKIEQKARCCKKAECTSPLLRPSLSADWLQDGVGRQTHVAAHASRDCKPGQGPGQIDRLRKGKSWHRASLVESLASSPKPVLPKAQARGGKGKQKAQLGQYYGSCTVLEGETLVWKRPGQCPVPPLTLFLAS